MFEIFQISIIEYFYLSEPAIVFILNYESIHFKVFLSYHVISKFFNLNYFHLFEND